MFFIMVTIQSEFNRYYLDYFSHPYTISGSYAGSYSRCSALLYLKFNNEYAGTIYFRDELPIRQNFTIANKPALNFHLSQFDDIVNIVRYEKPLYLILSTENWNGSISTNLEPVGEQEI